MLVIDKGLDFLEAVGSAKETNEKKRDFKKQHRYL